MPGVSAFSAASSLIGYLYQMRVALLWSLQRLPEGAEFLVSVETLDDVMFESENGSPQELVQTKHHQSRVATLANASPDLWKSLRVWFEGCEEGSIPPGTTLNLLTTAAAQEGTAASRMRATGRDVDAALFALETTARSSVNRVNEPAYSAFLRATSECRRRLLASVVVLDSAPVIAEIEQELRHAIFSAVERKNLDSFLDRLEGWWIRRVLRQLQNPDERVHADEIEAKMGDLREQFKQDALPIDDDLLDFGLDDATFEAHARFTFVRQIELTRANERRIARAILDYYRAFEQRSRWLREDLLLTDEIRRYERRLVDEWDRVFTAMLDEIGEAATEDVKSNAARNVLKWAEQCVIPIRPNVTESFVARGSLHMLADERQVGWHPDFRARLAEVLSPRGDVR